jgi:transcription elongation factor GreA
MHNLMPISQTGQAKLREELSELEKEAAQVRQRVCEAREQGDLKENSEFIYGRQHLGFIEGNLGEIRGKINYSQVIDCTQVPCDRVAFGTVVTLLDLETKEKKTYQLLGPYDSDLTDNSISILSPIGDALIGLAVGEKISVNVPRGTLHFELLEIAKSKIQ